MAEREGKGERNEAATCFILRGERKETTMSVEEKEDIGSPCFIPP